MPPGTFVRVSPRRVCAVPLERLVAGSPGPDELRRSRGLWGPPTHRPDAACACAIFRPCEASHARRSGPPRVRSVVARSLPRALRLRQRCLQLRAVVLARAARPRGRVDGRERGARSRRERGAVRDRRRRARCTAPERAGHGFAPAASALRRPARRRRGPARGAARRCAHGRAGRGRRRPHPHPVPAPARGPARRAGSRERVRRLPPGRDGPLRPDRHGPRAVPAQPAPAHRGLPPREGHGRAPEDAGRVPGLHRRRGALVARGEFPRPARRAAARGPVGRRLGQQHAVVPGPVRG
jgi:hypothetical protein